MSNTPVFQILKYEYGVEFDPSKNLKKQLQELQEKDPQKFSEVVSFLKKYGDQVATDIGFSISFSDLKPVKELKPRENMSVDEAIKLQSELPSKLLEKLPDDNSFKQMVKSKVRGKPAQLMQLIVSPVLFSDAKNRPFPIIIKNSFAEGLSPLEYFASSVGARKGIIAQQTSTSEPGTINKELLPNVISMKVVMDDCGTTQGEVFSIDDRAVLDRYLAKQHGSYPRNTLVTIDIRDKLKKEGFKELEVRTPLHCLAKDGVCAKCLGPVGVRKNPEIGFSIGAASGQAISEPLTQFALSFKHTGGLANIAKGTALELVKKIFNAPENFKNKATLSLKDGKISKIEKAPLGGHFVYVDNEKHFVPADQNLTVKLGDKVERGDPLSEGLVNVKELMELKGLQATRRYIADALRTVYETQGIDIHPKHFEVVARAITKHVKVDNPGNTEFAKDEILDYDALKDYLNKNFSVKEVEKKDSLGKYLAEPIAFFVPGQKIEQHMLKHLPDKVPVVNENLGDFKISPVYISLNKQHLYNKDWVMALNRSELKKVLTDGVHYGKVADLQWYHPIPNLNEN